MKRLTLIILILLGACDKQAASSNGHVAPAGLPSAQAVTVTAAPSATPASLATPLDTSAVNLAKPSPAIAQQPLSVNGWVAGALFADIQSRIPDYAAVEQNHEYYEIKFDDTMLMFAQSGQLTFLLVNGSEGSLSNGLRIGDAETEIVKLLGQPGNENAEGYHAYVYTFPEYRVEIDTVGMQVNALRLTYLGEELAVEDPALHAYVRDNRQAAAATQATTPARNQTNEQAASQSSQPRRITFDTYVQISDDLLNALVQYTQIMSKDEADSEKLKELERLDAKYQINERALLLETAVPDDDKDRSLHARCAAFAAKVDSLLGTGMFYLNIKMKETDEQVVAGWKQRAAQELQAVWAWAGQK
ncbi:hypothetical protein B5M42_023195 [Paenibacillus athensensis]|uniref:Uncharacterized protein n=1 Tax=Paenibacillus athensensis TaxID=1967502 RepID=A0A4Y8PUL5_9BACL|nr:hypothetical protein [Paenibacillus athensensis]MCD1261712.1 hypothetical protein [Paenibacillus athensensis]